MSGHHHGWKMEFLAARPCTGNSFAVYPAQMYELPLRKCAAALEKAGFRVSNMEMMVTAVSDGPVFTLYRTGRLLITPCHDEGTALSEARVFFSIMMKNGQLARVLEQEGAAY